MMTKEAAQENEACCAVIDELRAFLAQNKAPAVALRMCDEMRARIEIRRHLLGAEDGVDRALAAIRRIAKT